MQTGRPTLLPSHTHHTNAVGLRPAAVLDHSDEHARWVASLAHREKQLDEVLQRLAKRRAESEQAERARQEQEAAMRSPASNTLIRREWCCCAVLRRLWQCWGGCPFAQPPPMHCGRRLRGEPGRSCSRFTLPPLPRVLGPCRQGVCCKGLVTILPAQHYAAASQPFSLSLVLLGPVLADSRCSPFDASSGLPGCSCSYWRTQRPLVQLAQPAAE